MAKRRRFVAGNHAAWFSKKYSNYSCVEVCELDPKYMRWCIDNLHHLKFADRIKHRVNKKLSEINNANIHA